MGNENVAVNRWLNDHERFADLFNGTVFGGRQVVRPEHLEDMDRESDVLLPDRTGKGKSIQRYRDIVKRWKRGANLAVLACESQSKVHYAMPVRNMLYDSLSYTDQIQTLWSLREAERRAGKKMGRMTGEEFLSRFGKGDKLCPVITLVFYYDLAKWDGPTQLYDMIEMGHLSEEEGQMEAYLPNYRINLVDAGNIRETERFRTDLQQVFGMLKYRNRKEELLRYIDGNREYFAHVDRETYQAMRAFLHSGKLLKEMGDIEMKGEIDMCQALEELYADGVKEGTERGIAKGIQKGRLEGRQEGILTVIAAMLQNGLSSADIKRYTGVTDQEIRLAKDRQGAR